MEEVYLQNTDRDEAHVQTVPPVAPAQNRHDRPVRTTVEALIVSRERTVTCILSIRDKENGGTMGKKNARRNGHATLRRPRDRHGQPRDARPIEDEKVTSEITRQPSESDR